ncbi:MAG TPA: FlgD immunoglobulin-like domain containing protein [bacterium]|nr:FlgD immunoglobulin-like domain containing protein [bacterium]HPN42107.1 FlgD immunoglobulin-like domain containing protein [bacterium]
MKFLQTVFVFVLMTAFAVTAQVDPGSENLKHWWPFDDGTANDQAGEADGYVNGDAVISGGSLHITDLDDWVEVSGDEVAVNSFIGITVATWFTSMADSNNGYHMIVYFGDSVNDLGSNGLFISPCRGNDVSRAAISCGNVSAPYNAETGVDGPETNDGLLHHMAMRINETQLSFFVDGEWLGTADLSAANTLASISPNFGYIGRGGYNGDPVFRSVVHDVRVYDRALDDEEILFLFESGPGDLTQIENNPGEQPQDFNLAQNYPNPFNPTTTIEYSLPVASKATLSVYNMSGQKVATLSNGLQQAGTYSVTWNGADDFGRQVSSGLYIYKLETETFSRSEKMLLMK